MANLYLTKENESTTVIDLIMLAETEIYVFEFLYDYLFICIGIASSAFVSIGLVKEMFKRYQSKYWWLKNILFVSFRRIEDV